MHTDFVGRILHNLTNLFYIINQNLSPKPSFLCTMYVEALYNKAVQDTYIHIIQTKTKQVQSIQCRKSYCSQMESPTELLWVQHLCESELQLS